MCSVFVCISAADHLWRVLAQPWRVETMLQAARGDSLEAPVDQAHNLLSRYFPAVKFVELIIVFTVQGVTAPLRLHDAHNAEGVSVTPKFLFWTRRTEPLRHMAVVTRWASRRTSSPWRVFTSQYRTQNTEPHPLLVPGRPRYTG